MFTGIIIDRGRIVSLDRSQDGTLVIRINCSVGVDDLTVGNSIACSGVCLTVVDRGMEDSNSSWFQINASEETQRCTTLGGWLPGDVINLELALHVSSRLDGHIMSGHVDGIGKILSVKEIGGSLRVWLQSPPDLARYIAPKCAIGLDGVSLTVNEIRTSREAFTFRVDIIPHTRRHTRWGFIRENYAVNIEIDMLARYIERQLEHREY